jgi:hypothetical protein
MSAKKVLFLVTCMVMLVTNVCFAWTRVQLNDNLGAGSFQGQYDYLISQTDNGQRFYKMSELQHISNDGTVDIYGALNPVDKTNVIEYFCNQAGFVSGIVITSSVPETIMFQGTVLMELASEDSEAESYDTIYKLIKYSIDNNCACGYHSYRTNRYYDIRTVSSYGIYMTKITAGIK